MSAGEPRVTRPRPSWSWRYEWHWRGRFDVHGHRMTEVSALFSNNEEAVDGPLPNEIVLRHEAGQDRRNSTVRMSRDAAQKLIEQLQAALSWDPDA